MTRIEPPQSTQRAPAIELAGLAQMGRGSSARSSPTELKSRGPQRVVLDNTLRVTTPENISFEYRLAGPFRRFLAYLVDVLFTIAVFGAASFLIFLLMSFVIVPLAEFLGMRALVDTLFGAVVGLLLILYFLVYWFYGAFFETYFNGQTLGKRSAGLRVLSVNGHAIDGVQATLRNFFRLLDLWPAISLAALMDFREVDAEFEVAARAMAFPTFLVALTVMSLSRRFQRVGDLVADTVVVIDGQANHPHLIEFADPRVASLAELIPHHFSPTAKLAQAVANYVDLRRTLYPQRANEIAAHVAIPLMERFNIPADTNYDLFLCSLYYKTFSELKGREDERTNVSVADLAPIGRNFLASETLTRLQDEERIGEAGRQTQPVQPGEFKVIDSQPSEAAHESR